jgi:hypothetical protein
LKNILAAREPLYRKADAVVDTSDKSVVQALALLERAVGGLLDRTRGGQGGDKNGKNGKNGRTKGVNAKAAGRKASGKAPSASRRHRIQPAS